MFTRVCSGHPFSAQLRDAEAVFGTQSSCTPDFGEHSALRLLNRYVMKGESVFGDTHFAGELQHAINTPGQ